MRSSISFLLGSGFSAPMGYPIGSRLNEQLLSCDKENFAFSPDGSLVIQTDGSKPDFGYKTSYDWEFDFCFNLMQHFNKYRGDFDYEEFYDYIIDEAEDDTSIQEVVAPFLNDYTSKANLIDSLRNMYSQVVQYYIKDKRGTRFYDDLPNFFGVRFHKYTGIMRSIKELSASNLLNFHTLNHDLFFESFNLSDIFNGNLSDGFEELGSPYFGKLSAHGRSYMIRLSRYTGNYNDEFRLYKLHGSFDYEPYYRTEGGLLVPDAYIKTRYGIGHTDHYKEITYKEGTLGYGNSWINHHADFLTGTTSKIERYKEPLLFKSLFECFRENLRNSSKLIIIGYGAKDKEINRIILENYDYMNKPSFIIDPYAGEKVLGFGKQLNSIIIRKDLEFIVQKDFDC